LSFPLHTRRAARRHKVCEDADNDRPKANFEMTLPKAFFEGNPKSVTAHWIDFNRQ